jgi:hypothetical protein
MKPHPLSEADKAKAYEILTAGRLLAKTKAPYFRALLLSYVLREMPGLGTIGVTKTRIMAVDLAFVLDLVPETMAGILIHECLHSLNRHGHRVGTRDQKLFALAADLAINPAVREMGVQLPTGEHAGVFPKQYGFEEGLTVEEYYDLLLQNPRLRRRVDAARGRGRPRSPARRRATAARVPAARFPASRTRATRRAVRTARWSGPSARSPKRSSSASRARASARSRATSVAGPTRR